MTRTQRQVLTEARFGLLWLGGCVLFGACLTFPPAFWAALRHKTEETP